jgi:hypothetical protein
MDVLQPLSKADIQRLKHMRRLRQAIVPVKSERGAMVEYGDAGGNRSIHVQYVYRNSTHCATSFMIFV